MLKDNFTFAGYISKTRGIRGELHICLKDIESEIIEPGESVFVEINGTLVPFFVSEITPKGKTAVVCFQFVDSLKEARKISGNNIFLSKAVIKKHNKSIPADPEKYVGFNIIDIRNPLKGKIEEFIYHPFNPVFRVTSDDTEFLIPYHTDLIVSIDKKGKTIKTDLPEGLLNI